MLTAAETHILVEEEQMECQADAKLHGQRIEFNPHALQKLILLVHEAIHPADFFDEFRISLLSSDL